MINKVRIGVLGTFSESDFLMVWAIFKGLGPSAKSRAPNLYLKISICFVLCTRPTIIILDQYIREKMGSSYPVFKWHSITGLLSHFRFKLVYSVLSSLQCKIIIGSNDGVYHTHLIFKNFHTILKMFVHSLSLIIIYKLTLSCYLQVTILKHIF